MSLLHWGLPEAQEGRLGEQESLLLMGNMSAMPTDSGNRV